MMAVSPRQYPLLNQWLVGICFAFLLQVAAYPNGAPTSTCDSMLPAHGLQSNDPCPFEILVNHEAIFSNESLILTIETVQTSTQTFKGFLIMGFNMNTDAVVGIFKVASNEIQTLSCAGTYDTAATHTSSSLKSSITLEWIPPEDFDGSVYFKATFVETDSIYWLNEKSRQVAIMRSHSAGATTTESISSTETVPLPDPYAGCGNPGSKGCTGTPTGCVQSKTCAMMTTYRKLNEQFIELEIYGQSTGDQYVAIGFSTDNRMGKDSVVECVNYRNQLGAYQSFNAPGDINQRVDPQSPEFSFKGGSSREGYIYCKVQHPIVYSISGEAFNLSNPYYLLMANGPTSERNIERHTSVDVSSSQVVPSENLNISDFTKPSRILKQLHGAFMVIAWVMAASVGTLFPVYMKKTWVGKQIMGKDRWFVYHQALMWTAWGLTMAGFIIIFIDVGGWVSETVQENLHPLIGCITTGLAFINPLMAMIRPLPGSPTRYLFNWFHSVVGNSAHILALTSIFLTVEMEEAELPYETYWILTAHALCYLGAQLFLNLFAKRNRRIEVETKGNTPRDEPGSTVRKSFFLFYFFVVIGLGTTVIVFIAGV